VVIGGGLRERGERGRRDGREGDCVMAVIVR
jgi:hypothetical protein